MFSEAHSDYDQAIKMEPYNPRFHHSKGLAYQGQLALPDADQDKELVECAIEAYKLALKCDEKYFASRFHLGQMYHKNDEFQEALHCFTNVIPNYTGSKDVFLCRGKVYQDIGNHQFAIEDFNSALEVRETWDSYYY